MGWAAKAAREAGIDQRIVSTDGDHIVAVEGGVEWLARPKELAQDDTPMIDVVKDVLEQIPGPEDQIVVLLQPTQPFRTPEHVKAAIALLQEKKVTDSVISVTPTISPDSVCEIFDGALHPWQGDPYDSRGWWEMPRRRQDAKPAYRRDGTVYAFTRQTVRAYGDLYGLIVKPLIIPPDETCELDSEADWEAVERRWRERYGPA